jgi:hypothetical protein
LRRIETGVPQGSVLGPILFNLFFNEIADTAQDITGKGLFADDFSGWHSSGNLKLINIKLQNFLIKTQRWLALWRMKLSIRKTVYTIFKPGGCKKEPDKFQLQYNGQKIEYERNPKLLGVVLDPRLSFLAHAKYIEGRAESRMNMLRSLRGKNWGANTRLLLSTFKALIRSLIDYAPQVTITMCESALHKFETIQSKTVRGITRWPKSMTNRAMLQEYGVEEVLPRAHKLMDSYLNKAMTHNPLIQELVNDYKIAPQLDEGLYCKLERPHPTPLGKFKMLPATEFRAVAHL